MQLEFKSDIQGEIHGIGFESDNTLSSNLVFKFHGTQNWGIATYDNYPNNGQWVTYNINVGASYTGVADRLLFVADHDGGSRNGDSFYRNIVVFEDANSNGVCDGSESSVIASFIKDTPIAGNIATDGLDLKIYPNPVKSTLYIKSNEDMAYSIVNMIGQEVTRGNTSKTIDVSKLEAGLYMIQFEANGIIETRKFIKQ